MPLRLPLSLAEQRARGLAFVHQNLGLAPQISVLENMRVVEITAGRRPWVDWRAQRRAAEAERAARKRAADLKPPFMQKGVSRLYNITSQDVIKDPVAYATQQVEWARQERVFRDRYTRGEAIKAASDEADVLHVTRNQLPTSFGEANDGTLYLVTFEGSQDPRAKGAIWRIQAAE
jgi:hypothetical protein